VGEKEVQQRQTSATWLTCCGTTELALKLVKLKLKGAL
jgi:hypothetical protein